MFQLLTNVKYKDSIYVTRFKHVKRDGGNGRDLKISESEHKFMNVVWNLAPCKSKDLVEEWAKKYAWNKSTTYTQILRMIEQGLIKTENLEVISIVSRDKVRLFDSEYVIESRFGGSLPAFISAFAKTENSAGMKLPR